MTIETGRTYKVRLKELVTDTTSIKKVKINVNARGLWKLEYKFLGSDHETMCYLFSCCSKEMEDVWKHIINVPSVVSLYEVDNELFISDDRCIHWGRMYDIWKSRAKGTSCLWLTYDCASSMNNPEFYAFEFEELSRD